jgi:hypothetical protein
MYQCNAHYRNYIPFCKTEKNGWERWGVDRDLERYIPTLACKEWGEQ